MSKCGKCGSEFERSSLKVGKSSHDGELWKEIDASVDIQEKVSIWEKLGMSPFFPIQAWFVEKNIMRQKLFSWEVDDEYENSLCKAIIDREDQNGIWDWDVHSLVGYEWPEESLLYRVERIKTTVGIGADLCLKCGEIGKISTIGFEENSALIAELKSELQMFEDSM
tara:strand:+ start:579 stop:1079 length:501 start_codon:yes stop_codon:yes gene_type:complete